MDRLHRRRHAQRPETRHVLAPQVLRVLQPQPHPTRARQRRELLVHVQHAAVGLVADRVRHGRQAQLQRLAGPLADQVRRVQRHPRAAPVREARRAQPRRAAPQRPVREELHPAHPHAPAQPAVQARLAQRLQPLVIHAGPHPHRQIAPRVELQHGTQRRRRLVSHRVRRDEPARPQVVRAAPRRLQRVRRRGSRDRARHELLRVLQQRAQRPHHAPALRVRRVLRHARQTQREAVRPRRVQVTRVQQHRMLRRDLVEFRRRRVARQPQLREGEPVALHPRARRDRRRARRHPRAHLLHARRARQVHVPQREPVPHEMHVRVHQTRRQHEIPVVQHLRARREREELLPRTHRQHPPTSHQDGLRARQVGNVRTDVGEHDSRDGHASHTTPPGRRAATPPPTSGVSGPTGARSRLTR